MSDRGFRKLTAFAVVCCLLLSQSAPASVFAEEPAVPSPAAPQNFLPLDVDHLNLARELGKIEESYRGASPLSVILIQDAHAIPDAQKSIQRLIAYFQKTHGVSFVGLEGASSFLDATLFRSFPQQEQMRGVFREYLEKGELTAGTASAVFNAAPADYAGLEDWTLYQDGLRYYLLAQKYQPELLALLGGIEDSLDARKAEVYSSELHEADAVLEAFRKDREDLLKVLRVLSRTKMPAEGSRLRMILDEAGSGEAREASHEAEVRKLAEIFDRPQVTGRMPRELFKEFQMKRQQFQTSQLSASEFALYLSQLASALKIPVPVSDKLISSMRITKQLKNLEGAWFFREFRAYTREVKDLLIQNDEQRFLDRQSEERDLLERFVRLQLDQEDWGRIRIWMRSADERTLDFPPEKLSFQYAFYLNAKKRDKVLFDRLIRAKSRSGVPVRAAVMVAGGFHAEGLTNLFRQNGISYAVLMPEISRLPDEIHYEAQMKGDVSWKKHLKMENGRIDLYSAFVRGTRDRILENQEAAGLGEFRGRTLKAWRDQIIRNLSKEGRLAEAARYTRYIDEAVQESDEDDVTLALIENVKKFISGMKELDQGGRLTPQNVAGLLGSSMLIQAAPAAAAVPEDALDQEFIGFDSGFTPVEIQVSAENLAGLDTSAAGEIQEAVLPEPVQPPAESQTRSELRAGGLSLNNLPSVRAIDAKISNELVERYINRGIDRLTAENRMTAEKPYQGIIDSRQAQIALIRSGTPESAILRLHEKTELADLLENKGRTGIPESDLYDRRRGEPSEAFIKAFGSSHAKAVEAELAYVTELKSANYTDLEARYLLIGHPLYVNEFLKNTGLGNGMFMDRVRRLFPDKPPSSVELSQAISYYRGLGLDYGKKFAAVLADEVIAKWAAVPRSELRAESYEEVFPAEEKKAASASSAVRSELRTETAGSPGNPRQLAGVRSIEMTEGILPKDSPLSRLTEEVTRQTLKNLGLPEEEYAVVVSDSDSINAYFTAGGEKILVFNRGLLDFLERYGILNRDSIAFVAGHEIGHALQEERKRKDPSYKPSRLAAEYDADDTGARGMSELGLSPLGSMEVLAALREEQYKRPVPWFYNYIERTTHPPTHRRQVNNRENIRRRNYWPHLNAPRREIPGKDRLADRSARFLFDENLYSNFSLSALNEAARRASSPYDLMKLLNLFHILFDYQVILEEMREAKNNGGVSSSGVHFKVSEYAVKDILKGREKARSLLEEKFLRDNGVNPRDYMTPEQMDEFRAAAAAVTAAEAAEGRQVETLSEDELLLRVFAKGMDAQLMQIGHGMTSQKETLLPYASRAPGKDLFEDRETDFRPTAFWRAKAELYQKTRPLDEAALEEKAAQLASSALAPLDEHDRRQLIRHTFLSALSNLDPAPPADRQEYGHLAKNLVWHNAPAALEAIFRYYSNHENDYLKNREEDELFQDLYRIDRLLGNNPINETGYFDYLDYVIKSLLKELPGKSSQELASLYKVYLAHKAQYPARIRNMTATDYEEKITEEVRKFFSSFEDFRVFYDSLEVYVRDEFKDLAVAYLGESFTSYSAWLEGLEYLLSKPGLKEPVLKALPAFFESALSKGFFSETQALGLLDSLLQKYGLEAEWVDENFKIGGLSSETPSRLARAYAAILERIQNLEERKALILHYFSKYNHKTDAFERLQPFDALLALYQKTLTDQGLVLSAQAFDYVQRGLIPSQDHFKSLEGQDRIRMMNELRLNRERFKSNRIEPSSVDWAAAAWAWNWFFEEGNMPAYTTVRKETHDVPGAGYRYENTIVTERRPLSTLRGLDQGVFDPMRDLLSRLAAAEGNAGRFIKHADKFNLDPASMTEADFETLFELTSFFLHREVTPPRLDYNKADYDTFMDPSKAGHQDVRDSYEKEKSGYPAFWGRFAEATKYDDTLKWGARLYDLWLKAHPSAGFEEKKQALLKAYPTATRHRNKLLLDLAAEAFGNVFEADPRLLDAAFFSGSKSLLAEDGIRDLIARRIVQAKKDSGELVFKDYQSLKDFLAVYFSEKSMIGDEVLHQLLQDTRITLRELYALADKDAHQQVSTDRKAGAAHYAVELIADDLESRPAKDKLEFFEWLIGLRTEMPGIVSYYEYSLKLDASDLAKALNLVTEAERYMFLATLFVGPQGILSDASVRQQFLERVYGYAVGEADFSARPMSEKEKDMLFVIFRETFESSPELKQQDLVNGFFRHFLTNEPGASSKNLLIRDLLVSFGVVGVKLGQILSRNQLITDAELKKVLEGLSDGVEPLDKRYLMNALLFGAEDEKARIEELSEFVDVIGALLGSASVKQGYKAFQTNEQGEAVREMALKFIRPMAHIEVRENMEILRKAVDRLQQVASRVPELGALKRALDMLSDTLLDEIERAIGREMDMAGEVAAQEAIAAHLEGMTVEGWAVEVPRVIPELKGAQFFADEFIYGKHPKQEFRALVGEQAYRQIARGILTAIVSQMFVNGRYHADLHAGNIMVDAENKKIYFLDFGNTAAVAKTSQDDFISFLAAVDSSSTRQGLSLLRRMSGGAEISAALRETLNEIMRRRDLSAEVKLRQIKSALDDARISFQGEYEILFKVFETIGYLTDELSAKEKHALFRNVILGRQFSSIGNLFSGTTLNLLQSEAANLIRGRTPETQRSELRSQEETSAAFETLPEAPSWAGRDDAADGRTVRLSDLKSGSRLQAVSEYLQSKGLGGIMILGRTSWGLFAQPEEMMPMMDDGTGDDIDIVFRDRAQVAEFAEKLGINFTADDVLFGSGVISVDGFTFDPRGWFESDGKTVYTSLGASRNLWEWPYFSINKIGFVVGEKAGEGRWMDPYGGIQDARSKKLTWVNPTGTPLTMMNIMRFLSFYHGFKGTQGFSEDSASIALAREQIRQAFDRSNSKRSGSMKRIASDIAFVADVEKAALQWGGLGAAARRWTSFNLGLRMDRYVLGRLKDAFFQDLGDGFYRNAFRHIFSMFRVLLGQNPGLQSMKNFLKQSSREPSLNKERIYEHFFGYPAMSSMQVDLRAESERSDRQDPWLFLRGLQRVLRYAGSSQQARQAVEDLVNGGGSWLFEGTGIDVSRLMREAELFYSDSDAYSRLMSERIPPVPAAKSLPGFETGALSERADLADEMTQQESFPKESRSELRTQTPDSSASAQAVFDRARDSWKMYGHEVSVGELAGVLMLVEHPEADLVLAQHEAIGQIFMDQFETPMEGQAAGEAVKNLLGAFRDLEATLRGLNLEVPVPEDFPGWNWQTERDYYLARLTAFRKYLETGNFRGEPVSVDASVFLRHLLTHWNTVQGGNIKVAFPAGLEEVRVSADPDHLTAALSNIISNSFRFLLGESSKSRTFQAELKAEIQQDEHQVVITLSDNGPGFSGAGLALLDPDASGKQKLFLKGEGASGSTGLGLWIADQTVSSAGGTLLAGNAVSPQRGARFTITLPRSELRTNERPLSLESVRSFAQAEAAVKIFSEQLENRDLGLQQKIQALFGVNYLAQAYGEGVISREARRAVSRFTESGRQAPRAKPAPGTAAVFRSFENADELAAYAQGTRDLVLIAIAPLDRWALTNFAQAAALESDGTDLRLQYFTDRGMLSGGWISEGENAARKVSETGLLGKDNLVLAFQGTAEELALPQAFLPLAGTIVVTRAPGEADPGGETAKTRLFEAFSKETQKFSARFTNLRKYSSAVLSLPREVSRQDLRLTEALDPSGRASREQILGELEIRQKITSELASSASRIGVFGKKELTRISGQLQALILEMQGLREDDRFNPVELENRYQALIAEIPDTVRVGDFNLRLSKNSGLSPRLRQFVMLSESSGLQGLIQALRSAGSESRAAAIERQIQTLREAASAEYSESSQARVFSGLDYPSLAEFLQEAFILGEKYSYEPYLSELLSRLQPSEFYSFLQVFEAAVAARSVTIPETERELDRKLAYEEDLRFQESIQGLYRAAESYALDRLSLDRGTAFEILKPIRAAAQERTYAALRGLNAPEGSVENRTAAAFLRMLLISRKIVSRGEFALTPKVGGAAYPVSRIDGLIAKARFDETHRSLVLYDPSLLPRVKALPALAASAVLLTAAFLTPALSATLVLTSLTGIVIFLPAALLAARFLNRLRPSHPFTLLGFGLGLAGVHSRAGGTLDADRFQAFSLDGPESARHEAEHRDLSALTYEEDQNRGISAILDEAHAQFRGFKGVETSTGFLRALRWTQALLNLNFEGYTSKFLPDLPKREARRYAAAAVDSLRTLDRLGYDAVQIRSFISEVLNQAIGMEAYLAVFSRKDDENPEVRESRIRAFVEDALSAKTGRVRRAESVREELRRGTRSELRATPEQAFAAFEAYVLGSERNPEQVRKLWEELGSAQSDAGAVLTDDQLLKIIGWMHERADALMPIQIFIQNRIARQRTPEDVAALLSRWASEKLAPILSREDSPDKAIRILEGSENEKRFREHYPALAPLLLNAEKSKALFEVLTTFRSLLEWRKLKVDTDSPGSLKSIEWIKSNAQPIRIAEGIYVRSDTGSFRRHVLYAVDPAGQPLYSVELKIPGEKSADKIQIDREDYTVAQDLRAASSELKMRTQEPLFILEQPGPDTYQMYGRSVKVENHRMVVLSYDLSGHASRARMEDYLGLGTTLFFGAKAQSRIPDDQLPDVLGQIALILKNIFEAGYVGKSDLSHLQNLGIEELPDGRFFVTLPNDFGAYEKIGDLEEDRNADSLVERVNGLSQADRSWIKAPVSTLSTRLKKALPGHAALIEQTLKTVDLDQPGNVLKIPLPGTRSELRSVNPDEDTVVLPGIPGLSDVSELSRLLGGNLGQKTAEIVMNRIDEVFTPMTPIHQALMSARAADLNLAEDAPAVRALLISSLSALKAARPHAGLQALYHEMKARETQLSESERVLLFVLGTVIPSDPVTGVKGNAEQTKLDLFESNLKVYAEGVKEIVYNLLGISLGLRAESEEVQRDACKLCPHSTSIVNRLAHDFIAADLGYSARTSTVEAVVGTNDYGRGQGAPLHFWTEIKLEDGVSFYVSLVDSQFPGFGFDRTADGRVTGKINVFRFSSPQERQQILQARGLQLAGITEDSRFLTERLSSLRPLYDKLAQIVRTRATEDEIAAENTAAVRDFHYFQLTTLLSVAAMFSKSNLPKDKVTRAFAALEKAAEYYRKHKDSLDTPPDIKEIDMIFFRIAFMQSRMALSEINYPLIPASSVQNLREAFGARGVPSYLEEVMNRLEALEKEHETMVDSAIATMQRAETLAAEAVAGSDDEVNALINFAAGDAERQQLVNFILISAGYPEARAQTVLDALNRQTPVRAEPGSDGVRSELRAEAGDSLLLDMSLEGRFDRALENIQKAGVSSGASRVLASRLQTNRGTVLEALKNRWGDGSLTARPVFPEEAANTAVELIRMLRLPEDAFFEVMKNFLGEIMPLSIETFYARDQAIKRELLFEMRSSLMAVLMSSALSGLAFSAKNARPVRDEGYFGGNAFKFELFAGNEKLGGLLVVYDGLMADKVYFASGDEEEGGRYYDLEALAESLPRGSSAEGMMTPYFERMIMSIRSSAFYRTAVGTGESQEVQYQVLIPLGMDREAFERSANRSGIFSWQLYHPDASDYALSDDVVFLNRMDARFEGKRGMTFQERDLMDAQTLDELFAFLIGDLTVTADQRVQDRDALLDFNLFKAFFYRQDLEEMIRLGFLPESVRKSDLYQSLEPEQVPGTRDLEGEALPQLIESIRQRRSASKDLIGGIQNGALTFVAAKKEDQAGLKREEIQAHEMQHYLFDKQWARMSEPEKKAVLDGFRSRHPEFFEAFPVYYSYLLEDSRSELRSKEAASEAETSLETVSAPAAEAVSEESVLDQLVTFLERPGKTDLQIDVSRHQQMLEVVIRGYRESPEKLEEKILARVFVRETQAVEDLLRKLEQGQTYSRRFAVGFVMPEGLVMDEVTKREFFRGYAEGLALGAGEVLFGGALPDALRKALQQRQADVTLRPGFRPGRAEMMLMGEPQARVPVAFMGDSAAGALEAYFPLILGGQAALAEIARDRDSAHLLGKITARAQIHLANLLESDTLRTSPEELRKELVRALKLESQDADQFFVLSGSGFSLNVSMLNKLAADERAAQAVKASA